MVKKKEPSPSARKQSALLKKKATEAHAFLMCTGAAIHSVKELADELEHVDDSVYYYHAPAGRNDFAQWAQDVFEAQALAERMRSCHGKDHLRATIYRYLLEGT